MKYDKEILYVQKLYLFIFLFAFNLLAAALVYLKMNLFSGLFFGFIGTLCSYIAMVLKTGFSPPEKKDTAQRMAKEISHDTSPLVIARFASQLYFYLNDTQRAISLLEKYLPSQNPLVCATLGDIFLRENHPRQALSVIRDNPYALTDPLLLAIQGHALKNLGKIPEAIKIYERCLRIARQTGFPHNGAHQFTQWLLTLSYTASIHHALADCYSAIKNTPLAKKHYLSGNLRLFDITMWRFVKDSTDDSSESYTKTH